MKSTKRHPFYVLATAFLFLPLCALAQHSEPEHLSLNLNAPLEGATPAVNINADLAHKPNYTLNSWFAVGHFESEGHKLNYLVHLFVLSIKGFTVAVDSTASITDETTGLYRVEHSFHTFLRASADQEKLFVKTPKSSISGTLDEMHIQSKLENASIDLTLKAIGHPLYNKGTANFDLLGMDVFQYSIPTLATTGTLTLDGHQFPISGVSWFDRQWQNQKLGPPNGRWTWMDLNLSNDMRISLWDADNLKGKADAWVTVIDKNGKHIIAKLTPLKQDASDYWHSDESGYSYPTKWRVQVPELEIDLVVNAKPQAQEVNGTSARYEGASSISGTVKGEKVKGNCYVEMVGDWAP